MILDRRAAVPLYFQIYQHLLEQIHSETLQPGQPIPSESELAHRLGVSRMTARQAVKTLCDAGVAYSQRGLGTFVSGNKLEKTATELLSFTQETKARGGKPGSRVLAFQQVAADAEVARALHVGVNAKVFQLKRVRIADSVPMSIEESFLSPKVFPNLLETFDPRTSLYQTLAERYGTRMTAADEVVEASLARAEEARLLRIKKDGPVFLMTRISYTESNQPVEFVRSTYRGDRWKLVSRLTAQHMTGSSTIVRRPVVVTAKAQSRTRLWPERAANDGNQRKSRTTNPQNQEK